MCGENLYLILDINTNRLIFLKHPWNSHSRIGAKAFFLAKLLAHSDFTGHGHVSCHYLKKTSRSTEVPGGYKMFLSPTNPKVQINLMCTPSVCEIVRTTAVLSSSCTYSFVS